MSVTMIEKNIYAHDNAVLFYFLKVCADCVCIKTRIALCSATVIHASARE